MKRHSSLYKHLYLPLLALALTACGSEEQKSDVKFQVGSADFDSCWDSQEGAIDTGACWMSATGHEVLTRMAAKYANTILIMNADKMEHLYPEMEDFEEELGTSGHDSKDPMVRGNYATDRPELVADFGPALKQWQVRDFNIPLEEEWHDGPQRQKFHSLRDFKVVDAANEIVEPVSSKEACNRIQKVIHAASQLGLARWKGDTTGKSTFTPGATSGLEGAYFIGSATHTIQDSFSIAHIKRDMVNADGKNAMQAVCVYNKTVPGVCEHGPLDAVFADNIWDWNLLKEKGESRLKDEASLAMKTTGLYLLHMYRAGEMGKDLTKELEDFYNGSQELKQEWGTQGKLVGLEKSGTINCDRIVE